MIDLRATYRPTNDKAPVDCATTHTVRVIAVGRAPKRLAMGGNDPAFIRAVTAVCEPAARKALGGTAKSRALAAYFWVYFLPSKAQQAKGARWIRCDLALSGGTKLLRLPTDAVPALGALPPPDEVARCLTTKRLVTTVCARTHTYRGIGAFTLRGTKGYPSLEQFQDRGLHRCLAITGAGVGDTFHWTWPSRYLWEQGDHEVTCFLATKK